VTVVEDVDKGPPPPPPTVLHSLAGAGLWQQGNGACDGAVEAAAAAVESDAAGSSSWLPVAAFRLFGQQLLRPRRRSSRAGGMAGSGFEMPWASLDAGDNEHARPLLELGMQREVRA
jgi:hypothetical protein